MVDCANSCATGDKYYAEIVRVDGVPGSAGWGDTLSISVTVKSNNDLLDIAVYIDVHDLGKSPSCQVSTGIVQLRARSQISETLLVTMPSSGNLSLRISLTSSGLLGAICADSWSRTIIGRDPSSPRYGCSNCDIPTTDGIYYSSSDCRTACGSGGGGGGCDPACAGSEMCIFGSCIKRNDLLIGGAAVLAFMYFSKQ